MVPTLTRTLTGTRTLSLTLTLTLTRSLSPNPNQVYYATASRAQYVAEMISLACDGLGCNETILVETFTTWSGSGLGLGVGAG